MPANTQRWSCCQLELPINALFCPQCGTRKSRNFDGDPLIGTKVGDRYILRERMGHGASGTIYQAEHSTLRRKVAVKVLHHELSRDELALERFRREATTVAEVDNDHIVEILDFGRTDDGRLYLAMEYLEGRTLGDELKEHKRLLVDATVDILRQLSDALMDAHALGYVHRDLRPRNIFLSVRRGRPNFVKLLDFGLAKLVEKEGEAASTSLGMTFGEPRYMSPEQAKGNPVDRRADIYSLGCIAYEMLTGAPPFTGNRVFDILTRHVETVPPAVRELRGDVPQWLSDIIDTMLAKQVGDRFDTVFRMIECLDSRSAPVPSGDPKAGPRSRTASGQIPIVREPTPAPLPAEAVPTAPVSSEPIIPGGVPAPMSQTEPAPNLSHTLVPGATPAPLVQAPPTQHYADAKPYEPPKIEMPRIDRPTPPPMAAVQFEPQVTPTAGLGPVATPVSDQAKIVEPVASPGAQPGHPGDTTQGAAPVRASVPGDAEDEDDLRATTLRPPKANTSPEGARGKTKDPSAISTTGLSTAWYADGDAGESGLDSSMQARLDGARARQTGHNLITTDEIYLEKKSKTPWIFAGVGGAFLILIIVLLASGDSETGKIADNKGDELAQNADDATGASSTPATPTPGPEQPTLIKDDATAPGVSTDDRRADSPPVPPRSKKRSRKTRASRSKARTTSSSTRSSRSSRASPARSSTSDVTAELSRLGEPTRTLEPPSTQPPVKPPTSAGTTSGGTASATKKEAEFWAKRGASQLRSGDIGGAAASFRKALDRDPRNVAAVVGQGEIALGQGTYSAAIRHLRKATRMRKSAKVYTLLGEAYLGAGDLTNAKSAFQRALKINPNSAAAKRGFNDANR